MKYERSGQVRVRASMNFSTGQRGAPYRVVAEETIDGQHSGHDSSVVLFVASNRAVAQRVARIIRAAILDAKARQEEAKR
jgi:hypothetical protein